MVCFVMNVTKAQTPNFEWAGTIGSDSSDIGTTITFDPFGNIYNAGSCRGTNDFDLGSGTYSLGPAAGNPKETDIYITKSNSLGNLIWVKRIGDSATVMNSFMNRNGAVSIKTDSIGSVYLLGYYRGNVDFDPGPGSYTLNASPTNMILSWHCFILKLDSSGNFLWVKEFAGNYFGIALSLEIDANLNLFILGNFNGTIDLDPGLANFSYTSNSPESYIVKLDAGGDFIFAKRFESFSNSGSVFGCSINLDMVGNIYATGFFFGTVDFDPGPSTYSLAATYLSYNFVLKLGPGGNLLWVKNFGGNAARSSVIDATGIYITGTIQDTTDMDPGSGVYILMATGNNGVQLSYFDQFVLKLDLNGNFVWAKCISSVGTSYGTGIAIDAASNIYASGSFFGSADFDPGIGISNLPSNGGNEGFIQKLDANGNFIWARTLGGSSDEFIYDIAISSESEIFATGSIASNCDADPTNSNFVLSSNGLSDAFVFKWSQCSSVNSPTDNTLSQNKWICANNSVSLSVIANTSISWFATPGGTMNIGNGTSFISPPLSTGNYTFYAGDPQCSGLYRTAISVTVDACTGLNEMNGFSIQIMQIYPIPSPDGYFTILIPAVAAADNMSIKVFSTLGELILDQRILSEKTSMEIDRPAGIYFVHLLKADKSLEVRRIIKQ